MVAETGNKRKEVSQEDLVQAVNDIKNWFDQNHAGHYQKDAASVAGSEENAKSFLSQYLSHAGSVSLLVILSTCPEKFQLLDTYKLMNLGQMSMVSHEEHCMLLIAEDPIDGYKLGVNQDDQVLIFDT